MAAIQFHGSGAVVEAATMRDCPRWAIFSGKQFLFKYEGDNMEESISLLEEITSRISHSTAVYTLKFYEDAVKIKENTPCDGSFNFRLVDEQTRNERETIYATTSNAVLKRLEAIEEKLNQEEEEEEEEQKTGIGAVIDNYLNDPEKLDKLLSIGIGLLTGRKTQSPALNGVPDNNNSEERIFAAIQTLQEQDPQFCQHIEKLAQISKKDPGTFKMLLGMLDKF